MDKKPYYRRITDEPTDVSESWQESWEARRSMNTQQQTVDDRPARKRTRKRQQASSAVSNSQALKQARNMFAELEQRLRDMESHVTDSRFELQRELRKISGEN